jgi:DNA-binding response OmpR family regulator
MVDDNSACSEPLARVLSEHGHEVRCAPTASEAVRIIDAAWPQVLIADLFLMDDEIDGGAVARRLQAVRPGTPIIFVSAMPRPLLDLQACGLPKCRVFEKPADIDALLTAVREGLSLAA